MQIWAGSIPGPPLPQQAPYPLRHHNCCQFLTLFVDKKKNLCKTRRTVRGTFQLIAVVSQNNDVVLSEIDVNTSFTDKNGLYVICEFDFVGE